MSNRRGRAPLNIRIPGMCWWDRDRVIVVRLDNVVERVDTYRTPTPKTPIHRPSRRTRVRFT